MMKYIEIRTPCARPKAIELLSHFRKFMITNYSDSIWIVEKHREIPLGFPETEVCRIDMIDPETKQVMCILSMAYRSSEISLANITPTKSLKMNPIPIEIYNKIGEKFNSEVWQPFLEMMSKSDAL